MLSSRLEGWHACPAWLGGAACLSTWGSGQGWELAPPGSSYRIHAKIKLHALHMRSSYSSVLADACFLAHTNASQQVGRPKALLVVKMVPGSRKSYLPPCWAYAAALLPCMLPQGSVATVYVRHGGPLTTLPCFRNQATAVHPTSSCSCMPPSSSSMPTGSMYCQRKRHDDPLAFLQPMHRSISDNFSLCEVYSKAMLDEASDMNWRLLWQCGSKVPQGVPGGSQRCQSGSSVLALTLSYSVRFP